MLARPLLREHFQILASFFCLPRTNTAILLDWYCGISFFLPGHPNYLESVRVNIGCPMMRTDCRSFDRRTVK